MSTQFGKEEIVHLHMVLFQIKRFFESFGVTNEYFNEYDAMQILPVQIFRHKEEHCEAIIKLCHGILKAIGKEEELERIHQRIRNTMFNFRERI